MQGIDATFDEFPIERGRDLRPVLLKFVPGAAALALAGSLGVWALHLRHAPAPAFVAAQSALAPKAAPATEASNPFGDIIVDPSFVAEMQPPEANLPQLSSLEATPPGPAAVSEPESAPSASVVIPLPDVVPLPPKRDVPEIADTTPPLPPPRPAEFGRPSRPPGRRSRTPRPPAPLLLPTAATFSRSCSDSGRPRRLPSPARPRRAASPKPHRNGACRPFRRSSAGPARAPSPATTATPPSTTSRRAPSICPTERGWRPIRATGTSSTIHATSTSGWSARRRPTCMS